MAPKLPTSSLKPCGSHASVAAQQRPSGRSRSTRNDRSTITSPTTRSRTQISPGIRGANHDPINHNHSPPSLDEGAPVQISRALPRRAGRWSRRPGRSFASPAHSTPSTRAIRARRGHGIAVVATARKLACLFWFLLTRGEDYAHQQPSLTAKKFRLLEIRAGARTLKGTPTGIWATRQAMREAERRLAEQAEARGRSAPPTPAGSLERPDRPRTACQRRDDSYARTQHLPQARRLFPSRARPAACARY